MSANVMDRRIRDGAPAVRVAVALVCLLLVATACNKQSNASASGSDAASTGKADAGSSGKAIDVCTLVTKADVAAAYGGEVGAGRPADGTTCHFEVNGKAKAGSPMRGGTVPEVIVSLTPGEWQPTADQQKLFPGNQVTPVSGLGEEAWSSAFTLNVKHGADRLSVVNIGFTAYDANELAANAIALAKVVYSRL